MASATTKTDLTVANTIAEQMGGLPRLVAMIGAKYALGAPDHLTFRFMAGARNKANSVRITLDGETDTYRMEFHSVRGMSCKERGMHEGLHAEDLRPLFEAETGLYLKL